VDLGIGDRVALVCGASRGLGFAAATSLAQAGARIILCARTPGPLEEAAATLRKLGADVFTITCDLNKKEDLNRLVEMAQARHGQLDILVTNTAHPKMGAFSSLGEEDWHAGFQTIFLPVVRLYQRVLPYMQRQGWGRLVNISTSAVRVPSSTYLLSGVYRTALASLSKCLANEYGSDGFLVNTVCPGLFRTPLGESLLRDGAARRGVTPEQAEAQYAEQTAVGRIGEPNQLGDLIAFLCGQHSHITGQLITIDGGKTPSLF